MNPLASRLPGVAFVLAACLAADGSEVVPPATPGQFKAKFDRECAEPEKPIKTAGINFFCSSFASFAFFAFQPFALRARNCVTSRQPSRLGTPPRTAPASMLPNTSS